MDQDQIFFSQTPLKTFTTDGLSPTANKEESFDCSQRFILTSNINQLYQSRDKLRDFAGKIGHQCNNPIRRDVMEHCDKVRLNWNQALTFDKIEKMTRNRIQKMIKNKRIKKNWSQQDILIFIWIVSKYADAKGAVSVQRDLSQNDWESIAELIPGVQGQNCMFKWLGLKKNNLSDNCWSQRQSGLLDKIVKKFGQSDWSLISQKLYYTNSSSHKIYRCPKQCRQHWNCYLNPKLKKGPWSKQEDILLLSNVMKNNGQKKWAEIVKMFDGRTQNALKNRYTLIVDKQFKNSGCNPETTKQIDLIKEYLQRTYVQQFMSMENQREGSCHPHKKLKQSKKAFSSIENPKREMRTSLRKRSSIKQIKTPKKSFIDYSELIKENKSVYNQSQPLFFYDSGQSSQNKSQRRRKKQKKSTALKGNLKMKRANSMPQHLDDYSAFNDEKSQKSNNENIHNDLDQNMICDFYHPPCLPKFTMNNCEEQENQFHLRSSAPIFEQDEQDVEHNHNFWSHGIFAEVKYEKTTKNDIFHETHYCEEEKIRNISQSKKPNQNKNNLIEWPDKICEQVEIHDPQLNNYHESSFNFGSFEHFINNYQQQPEKKLIDTWDLLPSSLNDQYVEDIQRQTD